MLHALIMAGGSGTRFWPASRNARPKQFLKMGGSQTLIQATAARVADLIPAEKIVVVTNQRLVPLVTQQLPQLPAANVIGEPCKRDTAPCVALAAAMAMHHDPDAIQVVMPSDHVIQTDRDFQSGIRFAADLVAADNQQIVTFGIRPSYPSSAFGYIERDRQRLITASGGAIIPAFAVQKFKEKPSVEVAETYVQSGEFYWNAGIFVWKAATILQAIREFAPQMMGPLDQIRQHIGKPSFGAALEEWFPQVEGKSIDYAVMEHYANVAVVEAPFAWDDVGNWTSLSRLIPPDDHGNSVAGHHLSIDTHNAIVQSEDHHLVVTVGVQDIIVVQTTDATLIADRNQEEKIRQVVQQLQAKGLDQYL